jgi:hypothetical protein
MEISSSALSRICTELERLMSSFSWFRTCVCKWPTLVWLLLHLSNGRGSHQIPLPRVRMCCGTGQLVVIQRSLLPWGPEMYCPSTVLTWTSSGHTINFRSDISQEQRVVVFHNSQATGKIAFRRSFNNLLARLVPCSRIAMARGFSAGLRPLEVTDETEPT